MSIFLAAGSIGAALDGAFYGFDMAIFNIFGSIYSEIMTTVATIFTSLGTTVFVIFIGLIGLFMALCKRTRKYGWAIVFAILLGTLITNLIVKPSVCRIRPYNTLQHIATYWNWYQTAGGFIEADYCFPSGHTNAAFELATVLFIMHFFEVKQGSKKRRVAWVFPLIALLVGCSRIYVMVHYPSDVLFGIFFGIIAGVGGYYLAKIFTKWIQKRVIDDIVDLEPLLSFKLTKKVATAAIALVCLVGFTVSFVLVEISLHEERICCEYDGEYECQNKAKVDSKKYPPIDGKYYCKIHWKEINSGKITVDEPTTEPIEETTEAPTEEIREPITNTKLPTFMNDDKVEAFFNDYSSNPPVGLRYYNYQTNEDYWITDEETLTNYFNALSGMIIGDESGEMLTDNDIQITFKLSDGTIIPCNFQGTGLIEYKGKTYIVAGDNGVFDVYVYGPAYEGQLD